MGSGHGGPWLGGDDPHHGSICGWALMPGTPRCQNTPTWHVLLVADWRDGGTATVMVCDQHLHIARRAGKQLAEHPMGWVCGLPATRWIMPANVCVIDDTAAEPAYERPAPVEEMIAA